MNEIANSTFIYLCEISYDYGLITSKSYWQRIRKLYELNGIDPNDYYFPFDKETEFTNKDKGEEIVDDNQEANISELDLENAVRISERLYSKNNVLHFITGENGKLCKWKFNEYDADDKPSIPHGHGIGRRKLKLDPYRGLIFDVDKGFDKYESREDDKLIKDLWNDNDFRKVAASAISYHINNLNKHPLYWSNYRGLSHDPLRLPRKRK